MAKKPKIRELLDESACAHNKSRKSACNAPTPGATTGGCAFEGAQISLFPYADAAHLVHGPITCLGASWETRATRTSWAGRDLTQMGFTTAIGINDVVFGGEEKLAEGHRLHRRALRSPGGLRLRHLRHRPDRRRSSTRSASRRQQQHGLPVVPVHAPGFVGSKNLGSRLGGEAVLEPPDRHRRAGTHHPLRHQPDRRLQRHRRHVAVHAAAGRARHPRPCHPLRRRPGGRASAPPTGPDSTSWSAPSRWSR